MVNRYFENFKAQLINQYLVEKQNLNCFLINIRQMFKPNTSSEQKISLLEQYIRTLQAENQAKNKERQTLYRQIQQLNKENCKLQTKMDSYEVKLNRPSEAASLKHTSQKQAELIEENRILNHQIQELRKNTDLIIEELVQCRNLLENSSQFEAENQILRQNNQQLQIKVQHLSSILNERQITIESMSQEMRNLETAIEEKQYHVQMLQKDQIEYRQEINTLERQIKTKQDQIKSFQSKLNQKQIVIREARQLIIDMQRKNCQDQAKRIRQAESSDRNQMVNYNGERFQLKLSSLIFQNNKLVERLTALQREKNMYYHHIRAADLQNDIRCSNDNVLHERDLNNHKNIQQYRENDISMKAYTRKSMKMNENERIKSRPEHDSKLKRRIEEVRQQNQRLVEALKI